MDWAAKYVCRALSLQPAESQAADEISKALDAVVPPQRLRQPEKRNKGVFECPSSDS